MVSNKPKIAPMLIFQFYRCRENLENKIKDISQVFFNALEIKAVQSDPKSAVILVFGEDVFQVVAPEGPGLHQRVMHLYRGTEGFVSIVRATNLCQKHALQGVELCRKLLGKVLQIGWFDDF